MTEPKVEHLLKTLTIGDKTVKNRVALAPLTRGRAGPTRVPGDLLVEYYKQRANAGIVISEAASFSDEGHGWDESAAIQTDEQAQGWKRVAEAVQAEGALFFIQLWHTGRASHSDFREDGSPSVSASAIAIADGSHAHTPKGTKDQETPRALETDEIPRVVADYVAAAQRAKDAGVDGVEIHSANGYLLDQFLQSHSNKRSDAYGGSIENRYRLLKEVVEGILTVFPSHQVAVRLSPNGKFNDQGSDDFREQFTYVIQQLDQYKLGYLHIMDGLGFGFHEKGEPFTLEEARAIYSGPIMGNVGYTRETGEAAIAAGHADLIAYGRPFISNPDLVDRFANQWPLADPAPMEHWWNHLGAEGYTTYPTYQAASS